MKRLILSLLTPMILLASCNEPMEIKDWSFEISAQAVFNEQDMKSTLYLKLDKGCPEQAYKVTYTIDDDPSTSATEQIKFDDAFKASIKLPDMEVGDHQITLRYTTENFQSQGHCDFKVTVGEFKIHAEVNTGSTTSSALLVSLVQGRSTERYSVKVRIEDKVVAQQENINFEKTPIVSLALPLLRPGEHKTEVTVSDGRATKEMEVKFTEPLRQPNLDMSIERSTSTGRTRFKITSNPHNLSVSVYDSLVVKGRCDYHVCSYIEDHTENKTAYKEMCDIAEIDRFVPVVGTWYNLTDTQTKEDIITSQFMENSKWSGSWSNTGDGGFEYIKVSDGYSYFKIESSTHHLQVDFEKLDGITVNVTNSERDVILNKVPINKGKYSYKLK
ncbi:MAG: hypothetical protein MJY88_03350 [Bacteroidales bacterium]|nr:hypothetical protein [Bacteroidales bacterium]